MLCINGVGEDEAKKDEKEGGLKRLWFHKSKIVGLKMNLKVGNFDDCKKLLSPKVKDNYRKSIINPNNVGCLSNLDWVCAKVRHIIPQKKDTFAQVFHGRH